MITVLHLTPHLGGGVGKALSELVKAHAQSGASIRHVIVCLERPDKDQFIQLIVASGGEVVVAPTHAQLDALVAATDIVQLEWWNHPSTPACLCRLQKQPIRLLVWCHVSGLHHPVIPASLIEAAKRFVFTSTCSLSAPYITALPAEVIRRTTAISSGCGFDDLPEPAPDPTTPLRTAYYGSQQFSKLNPNFVSYLAAVPNRDYSVRMVGDPVSQQILMRQCSDIGRPNLLEFAGYTHDLPTAMRGINTLAYLLNPRHYGTAENALIETMAMGIVPIVLNNPAELAIVEHQQTGWVVDSPEAFAAAIDWLQTHPERRVELSLNAAADVRKRFTRQSLGLAFQTLYSNTMSESRQTVVFEDIFGRTPDQWFMSCQGDSDRFLADGQINLSFDPMSHYELLEKTKGSVFHFRDHYPDNRSLSNWAESLQQKFDTCH